MLIDHGLGFQDGEKIHELITREGSMDNISIIIRNKNEEQHIGYAIHMFRFFLKNLK